MADLNITNVDNDGLQRYYLDLVDDVVGKHRARFVKESSSQALIYDIKYQEALAGGGPFIENEAVSLGVSTEKVKESILSANEQWFNEGKRTEGLRLKAKQDIRQLAKGTEMMLVVNRLKEELSP